MHFSVVQHLDNVLLHVCGYRARRVYRRLLACLKSADWCKFDRHYFARKKGRPVDSFVCPGTAAAFGLTFYRDSFFTVQLSDPSVDLQRKLLDALEVARAAYGSVSVSLYLCEFALDFSPEHGCSLYDLSDMLFSSVLLRHSRAAACGAFWDADDNGVTYYQGNMGHVRCRWRDGKYVSCGKGLRCYVTANGAVRVELVCNKPFLKKERISVHHLPLYPETVNVLNYIEFRRRLSTRSLWHLVELKCRKQRPDLSQWPRSRQTTHLCFAKDIIQDQFSNAMVKHLGAKVGNSDETGEYYEYSFRHEDLPVALQISVFKELKKKYGFTNQMNEFFHVNKRLTEDVKRGLKKAYRRTVFSKGRS